MKQNENLSALSAAGVSVWLDHGMNKRMAATGRRHASTHQAPRLGMAGGGVWTGSWERGDGAEDISNLVFLTPAAGARAVTGLGHNRDAAVTQTG